MKKACLILVAMILTASLLHSANFDLVHKATQHLQIGGFYNQEAGISVEPITSSSENMGMPFNLLGNDVSTAPGRPICLWNAISNGSEVTVQVNAENLASGQTSSTLPYVLRFYYTLDGGKTYDYQEVDSEGQGSIEINSGSGTIELDGLINFYLPQDTQIADDSLYPEGNYTANVTLTIEGAQ